MKRRKKKTVSFEKKIRESKFVPLFKTSSARNKGPNGCFVYLSFSLFHRTWNALRAPPPPCSWEGRRYCSQDISRTLWRCCSKSVRSRRRYDSTWLCNRLCWPRTTRRRRTRAAAGDSRSRRSLSSPPNNPPPQSRSLNYSPPPSCNRSNPSRRRSVPFSPGTDLKICQWFILLHSVFFRLHTSVKFFSINLAKIRRAGKEGKGGREKKEYTNESIRRVQFPRWLFIVLVRFTETAPWFDRGFRRAFVQRSNHTGNVRKFGRGTVLYENLVSIPLERLGHLRLYVLFILLQFISIFMSRVIVCQLWKSERKEIRK